MPSKVKSITDLPLVHFQTGRLYAEEGQIISLHIHSDGAVEFNDHSRGIQGRLRRKLPERTNPITWALGEYDNMRYSPTYSAAVAISQEAWEKLAR